MITLSAGRAYGEIAIEPYVGSLSGYTLYGISGTEYAPSYGYYSWSSELKWPVDSSVGGLNVALSISEEDAYSIEFGIRKNIDNDTGKIEDSDYIENTMFIYSESDTEMDMLDLSVKGKVKHGSIISLMAGFRYQDFSFEASNVVQEDIMGGVYTADGLVGTYQITYGIPFIGASFSSGIGQRNGGVFEIEAQLGYVMANDEDDHVLRYKKSTSQSNGSAFGIAGSFVFNFTPNIFTRVGGEYMKITTEGKQDQRFYAGPDKGLTFTDIDLKLESSQTLATIGAGVRF